MQDVRVGDALRLQEVRSDFMEVDVFGRGLQQHVHRFAQKVPGAGQRSGQHD